MHLCRYDNDSPNYLKEIFAGGQNFSPKASGCFNRQNIIRLRRMLTAPVFAMEPLPDVGTKAAFAENCKGLLNQILGKVGTNLLPLSVF